MSCAVCVSVVSSIRCWSGSLAEKQDLTHQDFFLLVLSDEVGRRDSGAIESRSRAAQLDPAMTLEHFDKTANITFDKKLLGELCALRFLASHKHVNILGPVGVGKTFVANALGHVACRHGYRALFTRADDMLRSLKQSRFDNSRDERMVHLTTIDLLIIDDFALDRMSKDKSKDVYQLFVERCGRASMIVTSNRDTSEWLSMFDDALIAQSAVDRFQNAAYDLVIEGESYRPRLKPKLETDQPDRSVPIPKKPKPTRRSRRR